MPTSHDAAATTTKAEPACPLSLAALTRELAALRRVPAQTELNELLLRLQPSADELRPHLGFRPGTYVRHRVMRNEAVELLVLCWHPGQRTAIHDHNGSVGSIRVLSGVLEETMYHLDEAHKLREEIAHARYAGEVTGTDVPDIHRLGNHEASGQDLITIHAYAPPLKVINTYRPGSAEVGQYRPDDCPALEATS